MRIVGISDDIRKELERSGLLQEMSNLVYCDFLVIIEHEEKIIGASGIGGIFHVNTLIVQEEFRNKAIGAILLKAVIDESKMRGYSFISASRDPSNLNVVKLHNYFQILPIFQVKYRKEFTRDVIFLSLNRKGQFFRKLLHIFNTRIGMSFLMLSIKLTKQSLFKSILTYEPKEFPDPDVLFAIKNFEKVKHRQKNDDIK